MAKQNKKPHTIRVGRGIKANIWTNEGKNGNWNTFSIARTYKNDDGEFQDSDSFSREDLLHVAFAAMKAFDYALSQPRTDVSDDQ